MDMATELAIRAIVRGLYDNGAIGAVHVHGITAALKESAGAAMEQRNPDTAKELLSLCKGIKQDTAVA